MSGSPNCCPECGSSDIRFREKRNDWFCDGCDHRWTVDALCAESPTLAKQKPRLFLSYGRRDAKDLADQLAVDLAEAESRTLFAPDLGRDFLMNGDNLLKFVGVKARITASARVMKALL